MTFMMLFHLQLKEIIKTFLLIYIQQKELLKPLLGSKREINVIGFEPIFKPIVNKVIKNHPAFNAGIQKE